LILQLSFLKKTQTLFLAVIFLAACTTSGSKTKNINKDSVSYTANPPGHISPQDSAKYINGINEFYNKYLARTGFNGAILVAKNGQIIFEKYQGFFDLQKKDSLTEHSAFHLASVSKTFTAMATLKLAEQGKLKLDDDLKVYFPNFPYDGITIRMLLSHRSGLPNYLYFMEQLGWDKKSVL
jgi:Beta-lactamase class C and other penicillin binding proteins